MNVKPIHLLALAVGAAIALLWNNGEPQPALEPNPPDPNPSPESAAKRAASLVEIVRVVERRPRRKRRKPDVAPVVVADPPAPVETPLAEPVPTT